MAPLQNKRRRVEDEPRQPKKKIRVKKQAKYHSSSEDEDGGSAVQEQAKSKPKSILKKRETQSEVIEEVESDSDNGNLEGLDELQRNTALNTAPADESEESEENALQAVNGANESSEADEGDSESESEDNTSITSSQAAQNKKKRNDPSAFATSISKILDTKLTSAKRADPVLSRSKAASQSQKQETDAKLEATARAQLRGEKKQSLEKGRIKDVLGLQTSDVDTGRVQEQERRLRKVAQRGVVRLFNAVRSAQVKAEEGARQARQEGVVGMRQREERVQEMSKEGFLELISRGGATGAKV